MDGKASTGLRGGDGGLQRGPLLGAEMLALGLEARIMAAEFVQPFRKSRAGKNDRNDAEAIAMAVREANMRFVALENLIRRR